MWFKATNCEYLFRLTCVIIQNGKFITEALVSRYEARFNCTALTADIDQCFHVIYNSRIICHHFADIRFPGLSKVLL